MHQDGEGFEVKYSSVNSFNVTKIILSGLYTKSDFFIENKISVPAKEGKVK